MPSYVYVTVQDQLTIAFVPVVREVVVSGQVVIELTVAPRIRHDVAGPACDGGSYMSKPTMIPAPVWLTVNVCPAIVTVPVRFVPEAAATLITTLPLPVPLAPDVIVMNEAVVAAVHAQPLCVVTVTVEAPPAAPTLTDVGVSEYVHTGAGVLVPVPGVVVVVVVVPLGVAGVASPEHAAAPRATARSPSRESTFKDEVTPDNIGASGREVHLAADMRGAFTAFLIATSLGQTPTVATPVWSVTQGLDSPESVYFDAPSGFLYSSQIGGDAAAKDGNGRIAKLTLDGQMVDANWITGLNAPKGLRAYRGTLFTVDIDEVVGIDIAAGRISSRVKTDAKFLNDVATAPDGTVYATDSFQNRVYVVRAGVASVFVESPRLELPNGILVDGNTVMVATDGRPGRSGGTPGSIFAIDIATREITQVTTESIGTPDGLESDGRGGYIVADVGGGRLFHVSASGAVRQLRQLDRQPADICFIASRHLLVVPHLGLNRVSAYDLSDLKP